MAGKRSLHHSPRANFVLLKVTERSQALDNPFFVSSALFKIFTQVVKDTSRKNVFLFIYQNRPPLVGFEKCSREIYSKWARAALAKILVGHAEKFPAVLPRPYPFHRNACQFEVGGCPHHPLPTHECHQAAHPNSEGVGWGRSTAIWTANICLLSQIPLMDRKYLPTIVL